MTLGRSASAGSLDLFSGGACAAEDAPPAACGAAWLAGAGAGGHALQAAAVAPFWAAALGALAAGAAWGAGLSFGGQDFRLVELPGGREGPKAPKRGDQQPQEERAAAVPGC
ncbi:exported protein of unknown function [Methylacidimicrobium sp. AP8]|nr:exported protein of unknown function [Methylacidimicrobium sp. AP8]